MIDNIFTMASATEKSETISNNFTQPYSQKIEDFVDKGDTTCIEITSFTVDFPDQLC